MTSTIPGASVGDGVLDGVPAGDFENKTSIKIAIGLNSFILAYSRITLVLAISIFQFLFPWIDKSKIRPCDDFSNTLKKFAMKSFSLISSSCGKSENFAMTQLPGGQYCHQVIY